MEDNDFRMQPFRIRGMFEDNKRKRKDRELASIIRKKEEQFYSFLTSIEKGCEKNKHNEGIWNAEITKEFRRRVEELEWTGNIAHEPWFSKYLWCLHVIHPILRLGDNDLLRWICVDRGLPFFSSRGMVEEIWAAIQYGHFDIADCYIVLPGADINAGSRYKEHFLMIRCFDELNYEALLYLARKGARVEFIEYGERQEPITLFMSSIMRRRYPRDGDYAKPTNEEMRKEVEILRILFETGLQQGFQLEHWERRRAEDRGGFILNIDRLLRGNAGIIHQQDKPRLRSIPSVIRSMKRRGDNHLFEEALRHLGNRYNAETVYDK
jgi:hypothetical protein